MLWFEADLYDQLQVVQVLSQLRGLAVPTDTDHVDLYRGAPRHPSVAGLGQLTAEQLARLPGFAATRLTPDTLDHAALAWDALRSTDPRRLNQVAASRPPELRFLAEAFDRLGREYPSTRDGLSLTERRILAALAHGAVTAGEAFVAGSARETRLFLDDTWCFDRMQRLRDPRSPC